LIRVWLSLALCGGCSDATQVVVLVEADAVITAETARLGVEIVSQTGERTRRSVVIGETADHQFPFRVPIVPVGDDASRRVVVIAEAFDAAGERIGVQRAHFGFASGAKRFVLLRFTEECRELGCDFETSCRGGACAEACVESTSAPDEMPPVAACVDVANDAGPFDAGPLPDAGPDGGPIDAGPPDAGPDAGPDIPPWCPTSASGGYLQSFDGVDSLASCGAAPCAIASMATAEVLDQSEAPAAELPCAGRLLHLNRSDANDSYFVMPTTEGESWVRAWLRFDLPEGEAASVLGLIPGGIVQSDPDGVELRMTTAETEVRTQVGEDVGSEVIDFVPADRWTCVELGVDVDAGELFTGRDATLSTSPLPAGLADRIRGSGWHARVGQWRPEGAGPGSVYVDHVMVTPVRVPCPMQ